MLSIFACPKPFTNPHTAIIQRNAITSWTLLQPKPEIILFGDEEGIAEICQELNLRHVPEVARNEFGTPLVNGLFYKAQDLATHEPLCYVNADIILMIDFVRAIGQAFKRKRRFLMVGQRWDLDIRAPLVFGTNWPGELRDLVSQQGQLHPPTGIDYFVFPRGLWGEIPPFAIGRTVWDEGLLYRARERGAMLIDATQVVMAVHQNHDWSHISGGEREAWEGPEAKRNLELAGDYSHMFTLRDATHLLTMSGLKRALDRRHMLRYLDTLPLFRPRLRLPAKWLSKAIRGSELVSARLGLTGSAGASRDA